MKLRRPNFFLKVKKKIQQLAIIIRILKNTPANAIF